MASSDYGCCLDRHKAVTAIVSWRQNLRCMGVIEQLDFAKKTVCTAFLLYRTPAEFALKTGFEAV